MTETSSITIIIGAGGGIGTALVAEIAAREPRAMIHALSRRSSIVATPQILPGFIDIADEGSIREAAGAIEGPVDRIMVATGTLHQEGEAPNERCANSMQPRCRGVSQSIRSAPRSPSNILLP